MVWHRGTMPRDRTTHNPNPGISPSLNLSIQCARMQMRPHARNQKYDSLDDLVSDLHEWAAQARAGRRGGAPGRVQGWAHRRAHRRESQVTGLKKNMILYISILLRF